MFTEFFKLGIQHILDLKGYDHMLFLAMLSLGFVYYGYFRLFILATAFTVGHSISLVLAAFEVVKFNPAVIEVLIPVTIMITGIITLTTYQKHQKITVMRNYLPALIFGIIHGLGFSGYLKTLLTGSDDLWKYLLGFNLGVETGQLIFILLFVFVSQAVIGIFRIREKQFILYGSLAGIFVSCILILQRLPVWGT